jgi:transcriptional regulator with XRE-family HTH domain
MRYRVQVPADERDQPVGSVLRRLREQGRYSIRDAATRLGWSGAKLSRIETSSSRVKAGDLDLLLDLYEADGQTREQLRRLLDLPPREEYVALPRALRRYAELEARATRISQYAAIVVPGLMQIPEYADAVIRAHADATIRDAQPEEFTQERLDLRLLRQKIFISDVALDVIIDEAVIIRQIGDESIMVRQMARLREFMRRPETSVRVLPLSTGAHPALTGPFAILDFPDGEDSVVFCDGLTGGVLRTHADEVERYRACFEALQGLALDPDDSAAVFADRHHL